MDLLSTSIFRATGKRLLLWTIVMLNTFLVSRGIIRLELIPGIHILNVYRPSYVFVFPRIILSSYCSEVKFIPSLK